MTQQPDPPQGEARNHRRYPISWEASIACNDWSTAERIATVNVSRGGMFVQTQRPAEVGSRAQVTLVLPDRRTVELTAVVRHCIPAQVAQQVGRPAGIGVEVDPDCRNELLALVEIARIRQDKNPPAAGG